PEHDLRSRPARRLRVEPDAREGRRRSPRGEGGAGPRAKPPLGRRHRRGGAPGGCGRRRAARRGQVPVRRGVGAALGRGGLATALGVAALAPSSPEPTLATILGDPSLAADQAGAVKNLYALWDVDVRPGSADPGCVTGRAAGLRCFSRTGTWTVLRRLNLPAILELNTPDGQKH